jgi:hypothetical protein
MNLLQALEDPNLFAPHFKGPSWKAWKAFLRALFGEPTSPYDEALFRAATGRTIAPTKPFTADSDEAGVRWAKSARSRGGRSRRGRV